MSTRVVMMTMKMSRVILRAMENITILIFDQGEYHNTSLAHIYVDTSFIIYVAKKGDCH